MHGLEALAVLVRRALPTERELRLGSDPRERRAELVRELGREPLLVAKAGGQPAQQRVQRGREPRQLVVRLAAVEAAVEVVLAPRGRVLGHPGDGQQRLPEDPVGEQRDAGEDDRGERHRADERDRGRLLVRLESYARDDGADPLAALHHRERVETHRLLEADRALRATRERAGDRRQRRRPPRLLHVDVARKDPDRAADALLPLEARAHDETPVDDVERRELFLRLARAGHGDRVVGEPLAEDEVEGGDADHERDRDRADCGEQEPRANPDPGPSHRSAYPTPWTVSIRGAPGSAFSLRRRPGDVDVERVVVDDRAVRPARLDELAAPNRRTRGGGEPRQEAELGRGQLCARPAAHRGVRARIEREAAGLHRQVGAAALDERAQPRHELREGERLRQVVVSSGREPGEAVGECIPGSEEEDGNRFAVRPQRLDEVAPVGVGQPDVDDHRVGRAGADERHRLAARLDRGDVRSPPP